MVTGQWVKQIGWPGHLLAVFLAWPGARSTSCSEVERESAYDVIDQKCPVQAGGRATDHLILVELQIHIIEFVLGKEGDALIEEILHSGKDIKARPPVGGRSPKLIGGFGKEQTQSDSSIQLHRTPCIVMESRIVVGIPIAGISRIRLS